jgi:hypothetical protein
VASFEAQTSAQRISFHTFLKVEGGSICIAFNKNETFGENDILFLP